MARKWGESDSRFLKKEDIEGHEPIVIVESVKWEEIGDEKDEKPVLYFEGKKKGMVCNKTSQDELSDLFGAPDGNGDVQLTRWLQGKAIQLYVDPTVRFAGKRVGGLRLRGVQDVDESAPTPPPRPEPPLPEHDEPTPDDEIPF